MAPARMVEVPLDELLDWGHEYEYFVDLLRDKVYDDEDLEHIMVKEYEVAGAAHPNIVIFRVTFDEV